MPLQETISKSFTLRAQGKLTDYDLAVLHQQRAEELGKSLSAYYDSYEGKRALQHALRASHYEQQVDSSCGDGFPGVDPIRDIHRARKAFGNPADRQTEFQTPSVSRPSDEPRINAGQIPWPVFNRAVELLAAAKNCTKDEAISLIYRAQKRAKEEYTSPTIQRAAPLSEDDEVEEPWDKEKTAAAIKRHMDAGDSYDVSVTKVLRQQRGH